MPQAAPFVLLCCCCCLSDLRLVFNRNDLKELVVAHGDWEEFVTRYPSIQHNYEVPDSPGLFVAGAATHSLDYRKSAGGSINGFRYTGELTHLRPEIWGEH